MKLPIKQEYFNEIKSGKKDFEYRDAHITFICEETGEELKKEVIEVEILEGTNKIYPDVLEDEKTICFYLKK